MKQNKIRKQTLESAQNGLEIIQNSRSKNLKASLMSSAQSLVFQVKHAVTANWRARYMETLL